VISFTKGARLSAQGNAQLFVVRTDAVVALWRIVGKPEIILTSFAAQRHL
jgi:hypothetical protein